MIVDIYFTYIALTAAYTATEHGSVQNFLDMTPIITFSMII